MTWCRNKCTWGRCSSLYCLCNKRRERKRQTANMRNNEQTWSVLWVWTFEYHILIMFPVRLLICISLLEQAVAWAIQSNTLKRIALWSLEIAFKWVFSCFPSWKTENRRNWDPDFCCTLILKVPHIFCSCLMYWLYIDVVMWDGRVRISLYCDILRVLFCSWF